MVAKFVSGCFVATSSYVIIHSMSNIYSYVNLQFTVHILYIYIYADVKTQLFNFNVDDL